MRNSKYLFIEYTILSSDRKVLFTIFCNASQEEITNYINDYKKAVSNSTKKFGFTEYINSIGKHRAYDSLPEVLKCESKNTSIRIPYKPQFAARCLA